MSEKIYEAHFAEPAERLAEICGEYLKKGSRVYFEGSLQTRSWEDRDGNTRYTTEVKAREMMMLDGRSEGGFEGGSGSQSQSQPRQQQRQPQGQAQPQFQDDNTFAPDDDLPF